VKVGRNTRKKMPLPVEEVVDVLRGDSHPSLLYEVGGPNSKPWVPFQKPTDKVLPW
jgi:hypothetical protein